MTLIRTKEEELATVKDDPDYHRCLDPTLYDAPINSIEGIEKTLRQLTFAPSCVDMAWGWKVEAIFTQGATGVTVDGVTAYQAIPAGFRFCTTFRRPDRKTGEISVGFGRWWEVPLDTTVSAVVKSAFKAAMLILEHELMESFKWKNARVFDPHNTVQELASLGSARYTNGIP